MLSGRRWHRWQILENRRNTLVVPWATAFALRRPRLREWPCGLKARSNNVTVSERTTSKSYSARISPRQ